MTEHHETAKQLLDGISLATVIGTLMNVLPSIAAALSIIWSLVRIYETDTVQKFLGIVPKEEDTDAL